MEFYQNTLDFNPVSLLINITIKAYAINALQTGNKSKKNAYPSF